MCDILIKEIPHKLFIQKQGNIIWVKNDEEFKFEFSWPDILSYQDFIHFELNGNTISLFFIKDDDDKLREFNFSFPSNE